MRRLAPPFSLMAALLASGCVPHITQAPTGAGVEAPAQWRGSFPNGSAASTIPDARSWWNAFGDPRLTALVEQAQRNNPDINIAIARVAEARAQEKSARGLLLPSLDASATGARSRSVNAFGQPSEATTGQPVFQASYEVDLFGRNAARIDAAQASAEAADANRQSAQLSVAAATASSYLTLQALDSRLMLLRATLATREDSVRLARRREQAGYTSELELRQAEAEYQATAQQIPIVQTAIARQENALSVLVGVPPAEVQRVSNFAALHAPSVPQSLPSQLAQNRPDILYAAHNLAATDANLRAAQRQFLPQIRLTASAGAVASSLLGDPISIWSLGGSILAPIFSRGQLSAQFEGATAQRNQAAFAYQRAVLNGFREVEDQLAILARLNDQENALRQQEVAVTDLLRHATNRYQAGYSTYLEQVDAQRALLSVQLALIQLKADRLTASVALYQALGGSPEAPTTPTP